MTEIAFVSDIHGNLLALQAVDAHLRTKPVDAVVCLGDLAAMGPRPNECIGFVRSMGWPTVLGNTDAWLLGDLEMPARILKLEPRAMPLARDVVAWGKEALSSDNRRFLDQLRQVFPYRVPNSGREISCCHGSPRSFEDRLLATTPPDVVDAMLEQTSQSLIAAGHTHIPLVRRHKDILVVNPGSVGLPFRDGTRPPNGMELAAVAQYARLSFSADSLSVELHEVQIDVHELESDVLNTGMPHREWWISLWEESLR
jgi:putative phosphoesterase